MSKSIFRNTLLRLAPALLLTAGALGSCNSEKSEEPPYEPAMSVAVTGFSLSPNAKVLANLDSVFFSIDLNHGVIFNADSLPVGTRIDKLVPKITFPAAVTKAEITMTGGTTRTGTVDFKTSPTDSIDFSGKVTLTLSTENEALSKTYDIRVNVHKMVADSLMWDRTALAPLPSASGTPRSQRTVALADRTFTLVEEADGSVAMSVSSDLASARWSTTRLTLPFTPQVRSLTAAGSKLYLLSDSGDLYSSADGSAWQACGVKWQTLVGGFGDAVLGVRPDNGKLYHDIYPRPADFRAVEIPADFPTANLSEFHSFTSQWAADPIGLFVGGSRDGVVTGETWAYDGASWAKISHVPLPDLEGVLVVPYFNYRKTATSWVQTEFSVLLALGGRAQDRTLNRTVYLSYDNGVNWMKANTLLQLPDYIPALWQADAVVRTSPMNADLNAHWQTRAIRMAAHARPGYFSADVKRINYNVDGADVDWECPYIYMFGGLSDGNVLNPFVWRAVLARLTFTPLF